ncbi:MULTISPECIES: hypothetical protein [unclassified Sphingobium]|uniref:hypothetical protein n=1 Tax=unclassified Sphingobium TaxID=2611147 RepID=UPI0022241ED1|nr:MULTISPECIES: hypothetical protein [unclassified Sphingobium]MCW2411186.1 hypothetical protein [Sphingobium sp. B8D3D]MCW2416522.1 hypothetical protein [Sphingobium sp. B8D3A]
MNRVRKTKLRLIGAMALSSTVMMGTAAVAASTASAFLLYTASIKLKGLNLVKWADVLSVLTLASLPSTSSGTKPSGSSTTTISTPGSATTVGTGSAVSGVPTMKLGINLTPLTTYVGNRSFMNLLDGWRLVTAQGVWTDMPQDRLDSNKRLVDLRAGEAGIRALALPTRSLWGESVDIICRWQGTGSVSVGGEPVKNARVSGKSLTFTFVPKGGAGTWLRFANINPSDPIRNADCREVDADPNATFDPTYLAEVKRYGVLRFMKWSYGGVEGNLPVRWETRTKLGDEVVNGPDGVALEYMIQLANELKADPWFCVPWNADDEYVRKFAELVRTRLDPSLKAYVEVSNEVWNYVYPVTTQALNEGKAAGLSTNDHMAMLSRYAQKTGQVMDIWSSVFAGQMHRIVRVAAIQTGAWNANFVLSFGDTAKKVDAVAIAPYFAANLSATAFDTPADVDAVFASLSDQVADRIAESKKVKEVATTFGLRTITYEAGQHVLGSPSLEKMTALQRDPRMSKLYTTYLTKWRNEVGDLMVMFSDYGGSGKWGSWGQRDYVGQPLSMANKENAVELFRRSYITR